MHLTCSLADLDMNWHQHLIFKSAENITIAGQIMVNDLIIHYLANNGDIVGRFKHAILTVTGHAVKSVEWVEQETEHIVLRCSCVDGYWGRGVGASSFWLRSTNEYVEDLEALGWAETHFPKFDNKFREDDDVLTTSCTDWLLILTQIFVLAFSKKAMVCILLPWRFNCTHSISRTSSEEQIIVILFAWHIVNLNWSLLPIVSKVQEGGILDD